MRLIDADIVTQSIENLMANGATVEQALNAQPTAYDVDKVVERLGKLPTCSNWNHNSNNIDRKQAIKIVKAGGINE